ncbi:MAG: 4'-phosphopantetheinyl transferase superfamily protein [Steroidobacteraceae bacterium]
MNPATLCTRLGSLFSLGAVVAVLREPGDPKLLLPAEAAHMGRAVAKRRQEFAAGRLCARRALAEFGMPDYPIRVGEDRQPIWPDAVAGSITHTARFCAAAVAERRRTAALGLDSEVVGDVKAEIWPHICLPDEIAWMRSLPAPDRAAAATLIFSAKEAFYKCQYPLVHERLNFHDVRVEAADWDGSDGTFRIHPTRNIALGAHTAEPMRGRYLFHEEFLTAGLDLAAPPGPAAAQSAQ